MSNGDGKGKGKSHANPPKNNDSIPSNESSNSSSFLDRITASATGLARNTFNHPTASEVSNQAAAALENSGKSQTVRNTGSGSSVWAESSQQTRANQGQASGTGSAGLRSTHHEQHIQRSENEFSSFLDGIDSFTPSEDLGPTSSNGRLDGAWERSQAPVQDEGQVAERTVAEQQGRDGEEVLAILSSPSVPKEEFEAPLEENENHDWGLSPEQLHQLRAMTKEIFPPPQLHAAVHPDDPLNLNPSFVGETVEAREHWREQWEGVLTSYADEVWGDLLPLVKEARLEMEDVAGNSVREKPTAVRRLEAILGHLQRR